MQYPSADGLSKSRVISTPAMQRYHDMKTKYKRSMMPKTPFKPDKTIAKPDRTPKARLDETPVFGHVWRRDAMGEWKLIHDSTQSSSVLKFELAALSWLHAGGLAAVDAWMADLKCAEESFETLVDAEPRCPVAVPSEVKYHFDRCMEMPVEEAATHCRFGQGGSPALMVALKLVHGARRVEFEAFDAAREAANLQRIADEKASDPNKGEETVGPDGETEATHKRVVEHQKCGGKGQTIKVVRWVLEEKVADDAPQQKKSCYGPPQRFFDKQAIVQ